MNPQVPFLSAAVTRLASARPDDPQYFEEVMASIASDPGLSAEAFRLANSAALSGSEPCESLVEAMMRVGASRYVALVLGSYLVKVLAPTTDELRELWRRNVFVAVAARELCRRCPQTQVPADAAFVAGMLHNVGLLALAVSDPDAYRQLIERAPSERPERLALERDLFGLDHVRAGEFVADGGAFPQDLREVIAHHDEDELPQNLTAPTLVRSVRLAIVLEDTGFEKLASAENVDLKLPGGVEDDVLGVELDEDAIAELQTAICEQADRECEHLGLFASGPVA